MPFLLKFSSQWLHKAFKDCFTAVLIRPEQIFTLLNVSPRWLLGDLCVLGMTRGWRWVSLCPSPWCSFPSSTSCSLMSPLGSLDLPPRGPFTWLTKVRKQPFFLSIYNGPISPPRHYQALHWHTDSVSWHGRHTGFPVVKPLSRLLDSWRQTCMNGVYFGQSHKSTIKKKTVDHFNAIWVIHVILSFKTDLVLSQSQQL